MTRSWAARIVAAAVALALLAGCGGGGSSSGANGDGGDGGGSGTVVRTDQGVVRSDDTPERGGKLVFGLRAESNGWNPATNNWAPSGLVVAHALFDTLSAFDETSVARPYLAAGFDHSDDYTTWTTRLRPGVKLSNGRAVDSEVVRRVQQYLKDSPITGPAYVFVDSITTDGPDKVVVKLTQPWVTFPSALATQIGVVADPDWLASNDGQHPIGTGPFILDSWKIGDSLTAHRNPDYWQTAPDGGTYPYLDDVEFRVITDGSSRAASLRSQGVDVIQLSEGAPIADFLADRGDLQVFTQSTGETLETMAMLNTASPPLDDPDARRALAAATDQVALNEVENAGLFQPAAGPFGPGSPYDGDTGYPTFDLTRARDLVNQVKARHGGTFAITMLTAGNDGQVAAQILQQQWAAAGVDVAVEQIEQASLIIRVIQGQYQATMWQQFDAPDPADDFVWWDPATVKPIPQFSLNFARNANPAIGAALARARATADPAMRAEAYRAVARELGTDVPYVWLNHRLFVHVASPRVVNLMVWRLPDGTPGLPLNQQAPMLHQVWLRR